MHTIVPDVLYRKHSESSGTSSRTVDILALAAHPDDVELACGGVIAQATAEGKRTAIVECTYGEMSSRGTPELRRQEAVTAAAILGITERWNLGLPDGNIAYTNENALPIIAALRYFRPNILLLPSAHDRHLDHEDVHRLIRRAVFQSGMTKIETTVFDTCQQPYRPKRLLCYLQTYESEPSLYVDISRYFDVKMRSIAAHASQVYIAGQTEHSSEPQTFISSPAFIQLIESRARHFGSRIGVEFAEGFLSVEPLGFRSIDMLM